MVTSPTAVRLQQSMWSGMLAAVQSVWGSIDRSINCMSHNERMLNGPGGLDFDRPTGNLVFRYVPSQIRTQDSEIPTTSIPPTKTHTQTSSFGTPLDLSLPLICPLSPTLTCLHRIRPKTFRNTMHCYVACLLVRCFCLIRPKR